VENERDYTRSTKRKKGGCRKKEKSSSFPGEKQEDHSEGKKFAFQTLPENKRGGKKSDKKGSISRSEQKGRLKKKKRWVFNVKKRTMKGVEKKKETPTLRAKKGGVV